MDVVFGPVQSWRLGRALCVDVVASDQKYCTFDCIYCPQGKRTRAVRRRHWLVGTTAVQASLESVEHEGANLVAFTGAGEPTLASNLGQVMDMARSMLGLPVVVLTNSSLMPRDDVKRDLEKADIVVVKLDAHNEELYEAINRPFVRYSLSEIVHALREFRRGFTGKLIVQMTVVEENKPYVHRMASIAGDLLPDELQVSLRVPWWVACSASTEVERICSSFAGITATGLSADGPSWEQIVDAGELHRSGRCNAEVMLMAVMQHVERIDSSQEHKARRRIKP